ncbi:MAG: hypothetical protein ACFFAS_11110 [Promethearchaeota archaeon]
MREYHLPFVIIVMVFGYQISFYLLYRYLKVRKEGLDLNKFFLAFSLLYAFGFTGLSLRHLFLHYFEDFDSFDTLINISHFMIFLAGFLFLITISNKAFNYIISTKMNKIINATNVIMTILIFLISDRIVKNVLILAAVITGGIFALVFHIQLIKKSTGQIKSRLRYLSFGNFIIGIAFVFFAEKNLLIFNSQQQEVIKLLFAPTVILGQIIVFLSIYDIPIFLEFNWKNNLIKLYVIDGRNKQIIYDYDFTKSSRKDLDSTQYDDNDKVFFSSGLIGIENIVNAVTDSQKEKITKIQQGDMLILLNHGDDPFSFVIYCTTVKKELLSTRFFLRVIKRDFQNNFKTILHYLDAIKGKEKEIFYQFNSNIANIIETI